MSRSQSIALALSTRNLSGCGTRVAPGEQAEPVDVTAAAALAALQSFAAIPRFDLVDVEAKIYLGANRGKFAVQNMGGRLAVALVPEAINTAVEGSPEEVLAFVIDAVQPTPSSPTPAARPAPAADRTSPDYSRRPGAFKQTFASPWTLAGVLALGGALVYALFAPSTPDGLTVIRDPARVALLTAELKGRYGSPDSTTLSVTAGTLTGWRPAGVTGEQKAFELGYRFAERDSTILLLTSNGAEIDLQPDRSLKFLENSYSRQAP